MLYESDVWSVCQVGSTVCVRVAGAVASSSAAVCPYTVPEGLRPSHAWSAALVTEYGGGDCSYRLLVMPAGTISVMCMGGKTDTRRHFGSLTFPVGC